MSSRVSALNANGSALLRENRYADAEGAYRAALQACEAQDLVNSCRELPRILTNLGRYQDSKHLHFHINSGEPLR